MPGSHNCSLPAAFRCTERALAGFGEGAKGRALSAPRDICAIAAMFKTFHSVGSPCVVLQLLIAALQISPSYPRG